MNSALWPSYKAALSLAREQYPNLTPRRAWGTLYPLIRVDLTLVVSYARDLADLELFVLRTLRQGGASTVADIAELLGLEPNWLERTVALMTTARTLQREGLRLGATEQGLAFLDTGRRIERREERHSLLMDGFRLRPLPNTCYGERLDAWLFSEGEKERWRPRSFVEFRPDTWLTHRDHLRDEIFAAIRTYDQRWEEIHLPARTLGIGHGSMEIEYVWLGLFCVALGDRGGPVVVYNPAIENEDLHFTKLLEQKEWAQSERALDDKDSGIVAKRLGGIDIDCEPSWLVSRTDGNFSYTPSPGQSIPLSALRRLREYSSHGESPIPVDFKGRLVFVDKQIWRNARVEG